MATTPEGKIKREIDRTLEAVASSRPLWWFKPIQNGMGKRALDYIGCCNGKFFSVEAKRDEANINLTNFQRMTALQMLDAGGTVFAIHSSEAVYAFRSWLLRQ